MINETFSDILNTQNPSIIINQVNALGYGAIGLMGKIRKSYPSMFNEYHKLCGWFKDYKKQEELFGTFQAIEFPNSKNILCNAFSQRFYTDTKYEAIPDKWEMILRKIISQIKSNFKNTGILYEIHCPNKIGVGMKPEEIDSLKEIVEEYFKDNVIIWTYHI